MERKEFDELYGRFLDTSSIKKKKLDVSYGPYERNKLDLYYPDEAEQKYPVIVFFHGGGFMKGDKGRYQLKPALEGINRGYVVVSANYRLIQTDIFPAAVHDAKAVIRFLKSNAKEFCLDKERIVVWGESSGGVLAAMIGCTEHVAEFEDLSMGCAEQDTKVKAVIDWYAPVDWTLVELKNRVYPEKIFIKMNNGLSLNEAAFGCKGDELLKAIQKANPANYLCSGIPPVFIEHGLADTFIPCQISVDFYEALKKYLNADAGEVELHLIENGRHGVADYSDKENLDKVFAFIEKWI